MLANSEWMHRAGENRNAFSLGRNYGNPNEHNWATRTMSSGAVEVWEVLRQKTARVQCRLEKVLVEFFVCALTRAAKAPFKVWIFPETMQK